ncbi:MAG TPA: isoleucine--tRNA ligase [Gemmatimonadales bacterium]|nr:isoleucine--tRNA ligase [Gemmatimonadales bacterium]
MGYPAWPQGSADALERELLDRWQAEGLFAQVQSRGQGAPGFVFFEGPPTANGKPGIHHVFARTIKDLICRYHAMLGERVTRIAGWDTHGLPVEIEVEKSLKISGKKDIEAYGVEKFNALCRESVFRYRDEWEKLSGRIGYWLDYEHPYITCSAEYVESVWALLKRLHERSLLYRGHRVLPYCPRCGTVLSSHELALGYEDIQDNSVYVSFPLQDGSGRELVVWTTTPWTLPSNVAVAVHPELEYAVFTGPKHPGRRFVLAVGRAAVAETLLGKGAEIEGQPFLGATLVGHAYARPLDVVPLPDDARHQVVVPGDFVTAHDGSGLVHMAPAFGADDYAAGKAHGLALVRPVAPDGTFQGTTWPELEGKLVTDKATNDLIIRKLKELGRWLHTEPHQHSYPHCWRCQSKLIYYARDSWFVRTSAVKERMLAFNREVAWHPPEVGSGRFGEWLENNVDWALSRDRYWGTPLPVWVCDRDPDHVEVIGSYDRLFARSGKPRPQDFDPHKPFIDAYDWACACGGTMRRTPEVIDTWFDSGAMPYAQWHQPFEHDAEFRDHFPADYICEGVDQTRGWFYSLLAIATAAFDRPAYRNVIVSELVLDAEGQKMSKSRGNVVDPWAVLGESGADAVRLFLLAGSQVWLPKKFDRRAIPDVAGGFLNTLRNTYGFFQLYAGDWTPGQDGERTRADRWILGRLDRTVAAVRGAWDGYDVTQGVRALMEFVVDDLSNWYVRTNRDRFWAPDAEADPAALATLHECLVAVARLLAPAAPFAADWLHRALTGTSVHLAMFPALPAGGTREEPALDRAMDAVRRLTSLARAARDEAGLKVRQPLAAMKVAVPSEVPGPEFDALLPLLAREVNVKAVELAASEDALVRLRVKANFRNLGRRYGKATQAAVRALEALSAAQIREVEAGGSARVTTAEGDTFEYGADDVVVEREVTSDWLVQSAGPFVAALDPALTPALVAEGLVRELVSRVQRLRREAGFAYSDRIALALAGAEPVLTAARDHAAFLREETLTRRLDLGGRLSSPELEQELDLDGHHVTVGLTRHSGAAA